MHASIIIFALGEESTCFWLHDLQQTSIQIFAGLPEASQDYAWAIPYMGGGGQRWSRLGGWKSMFIRVLPPQLSQYLNVHTETQAQQCAEVTESYLPKKEPLVAR